MSLKFLMKNSLLICRVADVEVRVVEVKVNPSMVLRVLTTRIPVQITVSFLFCGLKYFCILSPPNYLSL